MLFPQYIKEEFIFFSSLRPFRVYPNSLHSAYSSALTTLLYSLVSIPISLSLCPSSLFLGYIGDRWRRTL